MNKSPSVPRTSKVGAQGSRALAKEGRMAVGETVPPLEREHISDSSAFSVMAPPEPHGDREGGLQ